MLKYIFVILLVLLAPLSMWAQSKIYLQHQTKPGRQKKIAINRDYTFQTQESTYSHCRILEFTDSTLTATAQYPDDTVLLSLEDIYYLRKNKKFGVFEVTAYAGIILLSITPVVWVVEGGTAAIETLQGVGVLAAFSVPFLLMKEIGRKKDTKNKWRILTE